MTLMAPSAYRKPVALMLSVFLIFVHWVTDLSWAASNTTPDIHFTSLASGQQVYVQEIHTQPIVTIDTWVNTGSAQETAENNGVSHFLEHLLFKGTPQYKVGEIDSILESRGATFNAATSDDFTHYYITTASPYFQEALKLHADMLLNATIPPAELDRERKVVQEEINRSLDNPGRKAFISLQNLMFGKHPYAMDTLGPKANIQNISREDILQYYHRWYQPENFKTVIVGDVQTEEAVNMVNEAFKNAYQSQKRPQTVSPQFYPIQSLEKPQSQVHSDPNVSAAQLVIGFLAPSIEQQEDNYALDIAAMILGQGQSSRLYQRLKEEHQLVNDIAAGNSTQQQSGTVYISAEIKPENRAAAKKAILEEITRFQQEGPTPEELEKAKTQVIKDFAFLTESTSGVANTLGYNVTIGSLEDYTNYVDNIQRINAQHVREATRKYMNPQRAVLVEMIPGEKVATHPEEALKNLALLQSTSTSQAVSKSAASDISQAEQPLAATKDILPNGTTLLMKPVPSTQTVSFSIFAKGGRLAEPKPGVASLTSRVLLKGTSNRSAKALSQELERLGLSLSASSDEDYLQISGASVDEDLSKLLLVLQDVLANPTFPADEIEKERADMLETLKTSRDQPSNLMFEKLTEAMYPDHPYGAVGERLEASLPNISRDDLVNFYHQSLQPENLVISVTGNFDPDQVKAYFQQAVAKLPEFKTFVATNDFPAVKPLQEDVQVDAQKPEQAASWIAYGWLAPGISRSRDYITLKVINSLLGSGLSSRLFVNLREKQGLAYHVSSLYPSALQQSRFVMYIGTDPRNQEKVQEGFNQEIQRLQTERISEEELDRVKSKLIGSFALAHESNANQAMYLGLYETLGVGYQFDTEYPKLIEQVTAEDIQRVAKTYFNQPKVVTIVAPKTIREETTLHDEN